MCYIIGGNGCFEMEGQKGRFSCNQTNFCEQVERRGDWNHIIIYSLSCTKKLDWRKERLMRKTHVKKTLGILLAFAMVFALCPRVHAMDTTGVVPVPNEPEGVFFGDGYIREWQTVSLAGQEIFTERISYEDGTYMIKVTENGITSEFYGEIDYAVLRHNLQTGASVPGMMRSGRLSGYTYVYMKTEYSVTPYSAKNGNVSLILGGLSIVLAKFNIPLGAVTTLALAIASAIDSNGSSPLDTEIRTTSTWYYTYDSSGEFVCYYVECAASTYTKNVYGDWVYMGSQSWDYETLWT